MRCLQDYIAAVRDYIDEDAANESDWNDSRLAKHINNEIRRRIVPAIARKKDDFFGQWVMIPLTTSTWSYLLPSGAIRYIELFTAGVTAVGNGVYTVDESAEHHEVDRIQTIGDRDDYGWLAQQGVSGYILFGNRLILGTGTENVTTGNYLRVWLIPDVAPIHYGSMVSAAASSITIQRANITNDNDGYDIGDCRQESNAYLGYGVSIYSATGAGEGQERTIIGDSFNGTTHVLTVSPAWDATPAGTVAYSLYPPFPEAFDDALEMGAAIRSKVKVEDPQSELAKMYGESLQLALDHVAPRNKHGTRKVREVSDLCV